MNYSPIKQILVKDFMAIGQIVVDFEKSPIVCIRGGNDFGKSAFLTAVSVAAMHADPRDQKNYIRNGCLSFGIGILLADGTVIKRIKASDINKYEVINNSGEVWSTTKLAEGIPVQVSEVMGMIVEPETREFLHIRTCRDQLMFVDTNGSTNYKVMQNALKVGPAANAIRKGQLEVNDSKLQLSENEGGIQSIGRTLKEIKVYDVEPVMACAARIERYKKLYLDMCNLVNEIKKKEALERALGSIRHMENVKEISENLVNILGNVDDNMKKCKVLKCRMATFKDVDKLRELSEQTFNICGRVTHSISEYENVRTKYDAIRGVESVEIISVEKMNTVSNIRDALKGIKTLAHNAKVYGQAIDIQEITHGSQLETLRKVCRSIKENEKNAHDINECNAKYEKLTEVIKQSGAKVVTCSKCGETIVVTD